MEVKVLCFDLKELARQASNKFHRNFEQELPTLSDLSFKSNSTDLENTHGTPDVVQLQDLVDEKLEISPNEMDNGLTVAVDSIISRTQPPAEEYVMTGFSDDRFYFY